MEVRKVKMADDQAPKGEVNEDIKDDGGQEKIVIGEDALNPDEAKELIEQGKTLKQLKEQYPDVDFAAMPKEFTKRSQELAELKKPKPAPDNSDPEEQKRRKEIDTFFEDPYVQEKLNRIQTTKEQILREDLEFQKTIESLEAKYDGTDGRPKFDKVSVLKHGMDNKLFNPEKAYKDLHEKELDEWKAKRLTEKKRPTTFFERRGGTGGKLPEPKAATTFREATENAIAEADE